MMRALLKKTGSRLAHAQCKPNVVRSMQQLPLVSQQSQRLVTRTYSSTTISKSKEQEPQQHDFKAETKKLLDIVTHSLYTDKEIFIRELVSNCSDALEKVRHAQASGVTIIKPKTELQIRITTDAEKQTLTLEDCGIGMSKEEMVNNLGTIAKSGSKAFVDAGDAGDDVKSNIIGQFGVGFYSAFMVGNSLKVYSRAAVGDEKDPVHCWSSDGTGTFTLEEIKSDEESVKDLRGTRIVINLKDDCKEFSEKTRLHEIINKYSNFVSFPILLDGEKLNTVSAIWTMDKQKLKEEDYNEFYKYCAHAFDDPMYTIHFKADAPIDMKTLIFIPTFHQEKYGAGRMNPGVSLYSRKVLLDSNSEKILPNWLRFVKGVVDSDDLPISLARESMQDTRLIAKMNKVVTKKIIKHFLNEAKKNNEGYLKFFEEYSTFIKEGICTDFGNQADIAKLLRFNSSTVEAKEVTSLDEYISRCPPSQDKIYYMSAPSREIAEVSPYYEVFKKNNVEVLFLYNQLDDFVMSNLGTYQNRTLVAAESGQVDLEDKKDDLVKGNDGKDEKKKVEDDLLSKEEKDALQSWLKAELDEVVSDVTFSTRLIGSPALIVDHESAALRRMSRMMQQDGMDVGALSKQKLEINPNNKLVVEINSLRKTQPELGNAVARQLYDNALIASGLVDDPREMLPRLNSLLEKLLFKK